MEAFKELKQQIIDYVVNEAPQLKQDRELEDYIDKLIKSVKESSQSSYEATGRVIYKGKEKEIKYGDGSKSFKKMDFAIETKNGDKMIPISFSLTGKGIEIWENSFHVGDSITVLFIIKSNMSKKGDSYFTSLNAFMITPAEGGQFEIPFNDSFDSDNLPF